MGAPRMLAGCLRMVHEALAFFVRKRDPRFIALGHMQFSLATTAQRRRQQVKYTSSTIRCICFEHTTDRTG